MAGHLVRPVREPTVPSVVCSRLRHAHDYLVVAARETVPRLMSLLPETWGADAKREHVVLPQGPRPDLVSDGVSTHSFAEVVNQCATLERLIDTLAWAATVPELNESLVVTCNPTTSSALRTKGQPVTDEDHDLTIRTPSDVLWKFEISDVASENDGNGKERKDLISLGVLPGEDADVSGWPSGRSLLVVSSEFAERIRKHTRHGLRLGLFHYFEVKKDGATRIFEVREGPTPR